MTGIVAPRFEVELPRSAFRRGGWDTKGSTLTATVIIPARLGSTRFPAKILASRTGKPLVQHVVDQVRKCRLIDQIIVAADDHRIVDALRPFETKCAMTSPSHPSGTDRVAEV